MGLRINSGAAVQTALRTLRESDRELTKSLERLSTGLRINSASDDPSGLVISEQLRNQISGIRQAIDNSETATNLVSTAESALGEVHSLLLGLRESVLYALNSGGNDDDQVDAEQDAIDNAIRSIDRIAQTTKFGTRALLDGSSGLSVLSQAATIGNIDVQNITFAGQSQQQYTIGITAVASQAVLFSGASFAGTSGGSTTIRLTGSEGTQDISIASGFGVASFDDAINIYTADTGVYASTGVLYSVGYGTDETISVEVTAGTVILGAGGAANIAVSSGIQTDDGEDVAGYVNGVTFSGDGLEARVVSDVMTANITMLSTITAGTHTFTVKNDGLVFQLNGDGGVHSREQLGISSVHSSNLGSDTRSVNGIAGSTVTVGGYLSTLVSGGTNDLSTNASNALTVLDDAIAEISDRRAHLGAFQNQTLETNLNSLGIALEELTKAESTIRDVDFAAETANFVNKQVLFQSSLSVLSQASAIPQGVLGLLA